MKALIVKSLFLFMVATPAFGDQAAPGAYTVDPDHTSVNFEVSHLGFSFVSGRFNKVSGKFNFEPNGDSSVNLKIETASIDTNQKKRDSHLRSKDFFHANNHPNIRFKSSKVEYNNAGDPVMITGDLSLHGVTKEVSLEVEAVGAGVGPMSKTRSGYQVKGTILRSEFNMKEFALIVGDEIAITINIEGIKN